eukprot:1150933-Pelagomonas_calceolata.AAC.5
MSTLARQMLPSQPAKQTPALQKAFLWCMMQCSMCRLTCMQIQARNCHGDCEVVLTKQCAHCQRAILVRQGSYMEPWAQYSCQHSHARVAAFGESITCKQGCFIFGRPIARAWPATLFIRSPQVERIPELLVSA